jgi:hypothetical protein
MLDKPDYNHNRTIHLVGGIDSLQLAMLQAIGEAVLPNNLMVISIAEGAHVTHETITFIANYDWLRANYCEGAD